LSGFISNNLVKTSGSILLLILLFNFGLYLQYLVKIFRCPYPAEYGEGVVYNLCYRMSEGKRIYDPVDRMPYIHTPYTPLYFFVASSLMRLTAASPLTCRLVSLLCAFGIVAVAFLLIFEGTRSMTGALFFSLFLYSSPYFFEWSPLLRVDSMGIFFSLTGLLLATYIRRSETFLYLSLLFFLCGVMTKQSLFAAPISVAIYLFLVDRRKAFKFLFLLAGCVASLYLLLQFVTGGNFYFHAIRSNIIPYDLSSAISALGMTITAYYGIMSLAAISFVSAWMKGKVTHIHIYLILSFIAALSIGKAGGANNHLLEFVIAGAINAGFSFKYFLERSSKSRREVILIPIVLLLAQVISLYFIDTSITNKMSKGSLGSKKKPVAWSPYNQSKVPEYDRLDVKQYQEISRYIKGIAGPILCENVGLLTVNGKEVYFQPFQFKHLAEIGLFDEGRILSMIEKGEFSLIILTKGSIKAGSSWLYSDKIIDAIWRNYAPINTIGEYEIYAYIKNLL